MDETPRRTQPRNDVPILVGYTVIFLLFAIFPATRNWLGAQLWPVALVLLEWVVTAWEFVTGVLAWTFHMLGGLFS